MYNSKKKSFIYNIKYRSNRFQYIQIQNSHLPEKKLSLKMQSLVKPKIKTHSTSRPLLSDFGAVLLRRVLTDGHLCYEGTSVVMLMRAVVTPRSTLHLMLLVLLLLVLLLVSREAVGVGILIDGEMLLLMGHRSTSSVEDGLDAFVLVEIRDGSELVVLSGLPLRMVLVLFATVNKSLYKNECMFGFRSRSGSTSIVILLTTNLMSLWAVYYFSNRLVCNLRYVEVDSSLRRFQFNHRVSTKG